MQAVATPYPRAQPVGEELDRVLRNPVRSAGLIVSSSTSGSGCIALPHTGHRTSHSLRRSCSTGRGPGTRTADGGRSTAGTRDRAPTARASASRAPARAPGQKYRPSRSRPARRRTRSCAPGTGADPIRSAQTTGPRSRRSRGGTARTPEDNPGTPRMDHAIDTREGLAHRRGIGDIAPDELGRGRDPRREAFRMDARLQRVEDADAVPRRAGPSTVCDPIKPAPPVTRHRVMRRRLRRRGAPRESTAARNLPRPAHLESLARGPRRRRSDGIPG